MTWLNDINNLKLPLLSTGAHDSPNDGLCAMEMVAFMERLEHSDTPKCTCPVLTKYVIRINDVMPNNRREELKSRLPFLVGTVSEKHELNRAEHFAWAAIRIFAPIALRAVNIDAQPLLEAKTLRAAADAAAYAAYAADPADPAADADAADIDVWALSLNVLDEAIAIGPASGWTNYEAARIKELEALVS